ncbi:MAG: hypothetical protein ACI8QZ_004066 [Chlamydiales bacterium]|jgi:hypothetical protein
MRLATCPAAVFTALISLTLPAHGQTFATPPFPGEAPGAEAGRDFDFIGDLDGDGVSDLLIGYPLDDTAGVDFGKTVILSGATGAMIWEHFGEAAGDRFGETVAAAGDVDGDGVPDFIVSTPWRREERGGGWIFSGADFSLNISYRGLFKGDRFGESVGIIGDFDNDGFSDTLWSAPGRTTIDGVDRGAVYIYSGIDGATIYEVRPPSALGGDGIFLGRSVSWVGDVNNDGLDDFLMATDETDSTGFVIGAAYVISALDESILYELLGSDDGMGTAITQGQAIAGAGDINADGFNDFLVSSQTTGENSRTTLYSGLDGAVLRVYPQALDAATVSRVVNAGDMDGDGLLDQAIAGIVADGIVVYSGLDGSVLQTIISTDPAAEFGAHFASASDLDGDGHADLAIGAPGDSAAGAGAGRVFVYSGNPCGAPESHCVGGLHSEDGQARMGYIGSSSIARNDLLLMAEQAPLNKFGIFFYGPNAIQVAFGDGFRCVGGMTRRLNPAINTGANGVAIRALDLTAPGVGAAPINPGEVLSFQFWFRDPMGPGGSGFNLSDGLAITFCD